MVPVLFSPGSLNLLTSMRTWIMTYGATMSICLNTILLSLLALPLTGQITARQGSAQDLKQSEYSSPMVLELPLDRLKDDSPGGVYSFTDQDKFVCDDVSIPLITIKKSVTLSKRIKLTIKATTYVRPSYDRNVIIQCSIINNASTLKHVQELQFSAEEKKYQSDSTSIELSREEFDSLFAGDAHGKLKLVMTVASDR
jgi:hypothetical protein